MCGVPHRAADAYIAKLVTQDFKVAICEQVEEADQSKGLTERVAAKIIAPGTATDDALLDEAQNNYLMAVTKTATEQLGYSVCDISTGQLYCGLSTAEALPTLLAQYHVKELIITPVISGPFPDHILVNTAPDISPDSASSQLQSQFNVSSLSAFGLNSLTDALPSCATLLNYLKQTQKSATGQLTKITPIQSDDYMGLDHTTIHNLELIGTPDKPNLVQILNHTKTAMGARQLRHDISHPLKSVSRIEKRLDTVAALRDDLLSREEIRESLHAVYDLHRLITRISAHTAKLQDLAERIAILDVTQSLATAAQKYNYSRPTFDTNSATTNSLIILDEIGRGTSTVDGMSLAGAITDHIATTIQARTLFATHYHELLDYFDSTTAIGTYSMDIIEDGDAIVFTYKLIKGAANKSFGIHVAKMAGIPAPVIQKAEELLATFEQAPSQTSQLSLF